MNLLDRYVFAALLRGAAPVLLGLLGLFGFIELAEQLEDAGRGAFGTLDALRVVAARLPRIGIELLPVTCLLGTVIGLGALANQSEIVAMSACGIGAARLVRPLWMLVGGIVLAALLLQQLAIPALEFQAAELRARALAQVSERDGEHWTRSESSLIRIGAVRFGLMPEDIEIYQFDERGQVAALMQAARADLLRPDEWLLQDVVAIRFDEDAARRQRFDRLAWRSGLGAEQLGALLQADHALAPTDLIGYIGHLESNGLDAHRYRVLLWRQASLPLGLIAMALLGAPFAMGSTRLMSTGARVALGGTLGMGFYLLEQLSMQLGLLYRLPAWATGLAPDLLALLAALAALAWKR